MGHDLPGQIGITLVMPLGGIAFDDQILSFDVSQAAKLTEERAPCAPPASFRKKGSRDCRMENRYPAPRCRLLRPRRERPRRCAAEQRDELAPFPLTQLHPVPLRARKASQDIGLQRISQRCFECALALGIY
jgi:hypothetical protein